VGLALVWKPCDVTSQGFVGNFKRQMGLPGPARKNIGHSGTLDPFAEGFLLIGWDEATKLLAALQGLEKTYVAEICFGLSSDTLDITGSVEAWDNFALSIDEIKNFEAKIPRFLQSKVGIQKQRPPEFSAIKVDGKRSYELARAGKSVELAEREFQIFQIKHLSLVNSSYLGSPTLLWTIEIQVSSGTYIRALARDWGQELFSRPALLKTLKRSSIGPFTARPPSEAGIASCKILDLDDLKKIMRPLFLDAEQANRLQKHGEWRPELLRGLENTSNTEAKYLILNPNYEIIAWAEENPPKLKRVFLSDPLS
jgi:tRNA pseudouridine(55) synthase